SLLAVLTPPTGAQVLDAAAQPQVPDNDLGQQKRLRQGQAIDKTQAPAVDPAQGQVSSRHGAALLLPVGAGHNELAVPPPDEQRALWLTAQGRDDVLVAALVTVPGHFQTIHGDLLEIRKNCGPGLA